MAVKVGLLAEYSSIFPEMNETIQQLLEGIPKAVIIKVSTDLLAYDTIDHKANTWTAIINFWFTNQNKEFLADLQSRVLEHYGNDKQKLSVLYTISSLKLLQLGLEKEESNYSKALDIIVIDLFKIYLLLNQSFSDSLKRSTNYIEKQYPEIRLGLIMLNMGFAAFDLVNFIPDREFFCQSIKALLFFSFLSKELRLQPHRKVFLKKYGIKSMEEYYSRIVPFISAIHTKQSDGCIEFDIARDENYNANKKFLEQLAVSEYFSSDDIDFRVVRSTPLIKITDDSYRITHPLFFLDKLYKGLYFEFSKIHHGLDNIFKAPIGEFRSFYTTNFSEKCLLYEVMRYCFKSRYKQFSGEEIGTLGIKGAPDYYIRDNNYVYLIENKDVLINARIKENPFFEAMETELKKKFLEDNGKVVGIGQIINNIERVLEKRNLFDFQYKAKKLIIYPILVVYDIVYDTPGINSLFNEWFANELNRLKEKGVQTGNVKPLIILNIDTIIRAAHALRVGHAKFKELLDHYLSQMVVKKSKFTSQTDLENALTHQYLPSTKIIEDWLFKNYKVLIQHNEILKFAFEKLESSG